MNIYDRSCTDPLIAAPRPRKSITNLTTSIHAMRFNHDAQMLGLASRSKKDQFKLVIFLFFRRGIYIHKILVYLLRFPATRSISLPWLSSPTGLPLVPHYRMSIASTFLPAVVISPLETIRGEYYCTGWGIIRALRVYISAIGDVWNGLIDFNLRREKKMWLVKMGLAFDGMCILEDYVFLGYQIPTWCLRFTVKCISLSNLHNYGD